MYGRTIFTVNGPNRLRWIKGIDPDLYFEDGKVFFMSNGKDDNGLAALFSVKLTLKRATSCRQVVPYGKERADDI